MGKGSDWRKGHSFKKVSENLGKVKKTKEFVAHKGIKKTATKTTYKY